VAFSDFESVFDYAVKDLSFSHLIAITGLDEQDRLGFIYHLAQDGGIGLNLKTSVSKENPVLRTVTGHFAVAQIYERELVDLFGARVEGLPEGERYPLPDGWPAGQYPLRKDWKPTSRGQAHA
jgi:Ni,Fe-hydrogenase III component G